MADLQDVTHEGASPAFRTVYSTDHPNDGRHLVRNHVDSADTAIGVSPSERSAGDFYTALWFGRLGEAFIRADIANLKILFAAFSPGHIRERLVDEEDMSRDYAHRLVFEKHDRYAE